MKWHLVSALVGFSGCLWHVYQILSRLGLLGSKFKGAKMKAGEIQVLKDLVDVELPKIEAAEISRLPAEYAGIVSLVVSALAPKIQAALDAKIAEIPVDAA